MPHALWKGQVSFGLVSIPILLFSTEDKSNTISFHQIDNRNNARIRHQRVNVQTGKEVPWENVVKGYEYAKDEVVVVEKGELERVAGENAKTIAIENFVDKKNINFINVDRAYYLIPDKKGEKGYVILREALKGTNKVGIAKVIISTKEYLAAVSTYEDVLVLYTLRYDEEIRPLSEFDFPSDNLSKYKINKKEIEIAKKLIASMTINWNPKKYKDEYKIAVEKWLKQKLHHKPTLAMKPRGARAAGKSTNFIELLQKSLKNQPARNDKKYKNKLSKNDPKYKGSLKNNKKIKIKR